MNTSINIHRIPVHQVINHGVNFDTEENPEGFDFGEGGPRCQGPVHLAGELSAADGEVIVNANLKATQTICCSRCLDERQETYNKDFVFTIEVGSEKYLNLLPYFREELIVDQALHALCREDCKGLCAVCGINRNHGKCQCDQ